MPRADLIVSLVKAGTQGDQQLFHTTVEALAAEERAQHHEKFRVVIGRSQYKLCSEPCREKMREYHEEGNR